MRGKGEREEETTSKQRIPRQTRRMLKTVRVQGLATPRRRGVDQVRFDRGRLLRLARPSATALGKRRTSDVLRVLGGNEVGVLRDVVQQNGDTPRDGRECDLAWLALGDKALVDRAEDVVAPACGNRRHVHGLPEIGSAALRLGLLLDRAALVVDRSVAAHLGDATVRELADVRTIGEHDARETRADTLDRLEPRGKLAHAVIRGDRRVAFSLDPGDLLVELGERLVKALAHLGVRKVLVLVVDDGSRLHQVLARGNGPLQRFVGLGSWLDEVQLRFAEGHRVVADHLAVDGVGLLDAPLRFRVLPRSPGVQAHGPDASGEAFVGKRLLVWAGGLEADDGSELERLLDQFGSAGLDVPGFLLGSVGVADVERIFADIDADVNSDRIHDILSLSSSYRDSYPGCSFNHAALAHDEWRRSDSPAMYVHLGCNELAAMAQGRWPSLSGHSFRFEETSPLSRHTPGRNGGHYTTNGLDRGVILANYKNIRLSACFSYFACGIILSA